MHILLVADGRSPTTRRWILGLQAMQHRVTVVSTFPCEEIPGVEGMVTLPVAFGGMAGGQVSTRRATTGSGGRVRPLVSRFRGLFLRGRYGFGPLSLAWYGPRFRRLVTELQPDLVHGLRIPFEGMLAGYTPPGIPLVVSVWGNDLTLHAHGSRWMAEVTRRTLRRADGLMADAQRDTRLARQWGFFPNRPSLVVPGSGGIDLAEMHRTREEAEGSGMEYLPAGVPIVINPRGFRPGSVRNDVFFQAIPLVLQRNPKTVFVCPGMAGQPEALRWVQRLKIGEQVRLLPFLTQGQLWDLFLRAAVTVSVSEHDGTPNTLLEAMALGCFPVVGDIESLREWITPGVNGLLVEPAKPQSLAEALAAALDRPGLRSSAAEINLRLIQQRAEANLVRSQVQVFYQRLFDAAQQPSAA